MLPIHAVLDDIQRALDQQTRVILEAPPGAGKTTAVLPTLLDAFWLKGRKILMLEPRRLAARAAAGRMARNMGEQAGDTVGYRTRMDSRISSRTRIEVLTEGILTRMLQDDPELSGIGAVIFDEFHERHLQSDLGFALCLDVQAALRSDLRIMVMSATLAADRLEAILAPVVRIVAEGRQYPVEVRYREQNRAQPLASAVVSTLAAAMKGSDGSALVFLPGAAEIRRVEKFLGAADLGKDVRVAPLYGDLPRRDQDLAILPPPSGTRKIVLATDIAESSLTIEDVAIVVDSGLRRTPRFDPRSGMTRLETVRISRASADQRRGRAGRTRPGICCRLWSEAVHHGLLAHAPAEILGADLAPLVLELALWGVSSPDDLSWVDPPPAGSVAQAEALLENLGAIDDRGKITAHGKKMAAMGVHPRLAHMILSAGRLGMGRLACRLAALISERDPFRATGTGRISDLRFRLEAISNQRRGGPHKSTDGIFIPEGARRRLLETAQLLERRIPWADSGRGDAEQAGILLALAYPDRIAGARPGVRGRFLLSGGRGAWLPEDDPLAGTHHLVAAHLDGGEGDARIYLAAPVSGEAIDRYLSDRIRGDTVIVWSRTQGAVICLRRKMLGKLVLEERPLKKPDPGQVTEAMVAGIRQNGLDRLPWRKSLRGFQARVIFLGRVSGDGNAWPDLSDPALAKTLDRWLAPFLSGITRLGQLGRVDLASALRSMLSWQQIRDLERLAPTHVIVPSGGNRPLDYTQGDVPVLAVKIQEMFGATQSPRVGGGTVPVNLHLLSPAGRPVQITDDLAGFWQRTYAEVRKELRGRYPKHAWPEDPLSAIATRGVGRRRLAL
ncbi:MAG: ATP-dependent helicase HrpB [Desulfobacterales bacterium]|nr:ATP-dependent helicase HrpB [Desulfobacterales bacterium]